MNPIVRARLQMILLPVLPMLPSSIQRRIWWRLAPPGFREQAEDNLRRALAHRFADTFKPERR